MDSVAQVASKNNRDQLRVGSLIKLFNDHLFVCIKLRHPNNNCWLIYSLRKHKIFGLYDYDFELLLP